MVTLTMPTASSLQCGLSLPRRSLKANSETPWVDDWEQVNHKRLALMVQNYVKACESNSNIRSVVPKSEGLGCYSRHHRLTHSAYDFFGCLGPVSPSQWIRVFRQVSCKQEHDQ